MAQLIEATPPLALLGEFDIDVVPHQLRLVNTILDSGDYNWIIGEDVGMGKAVEVGLLLCALLRSNVVRRVLFICPAALMAQVQEEMLRRFALGFRIYGADFEADAAWKWAGIDFVIASMDRVKPHGTRFDDADRDAHYHRLMAAGQWDIVIADEAHHLGGGAGPDLSHRHQLAVALRNMTPRLILMSATPHRGAPDDIRRLAEIVRPDLRDRLRDDVEGQSAIAEVVLRSRKATAADYEGNLLFAGHSVYTASITLTPAMRAIEDALRNYIQRLHRKLPDGARPGGTAINLVVTTFRKTFASSVAAFSHAVRRRLMVLDSKCHSSVAAGLIEDGEPDHFFDSFNRQELKSELFGHEAAHLEAILELCAAAISNDSKRVTFRMLYHELVARDERKVVIFTEFKETLRQLVSDLTDLMGYPPPQIDGDMPFRARQQAMECFKADASVLISTDAGSEGLNLQEQCHTLVNADIPWNGAVLVQRLGRVYRYGQSEHVSVVNMVVEDTLDDRVQVAALARIDRVARDMALVSPEFGEAYQAQIFGDLTNRRDLSSAVASLMADKGTLGHRLANSDAARRCEQQNSDPNLMEACAERLASARSKPDSPTTMDLMIFIVRSAKLVGVRAVVLDNEREHFELHLPKSMVGKLPDFHFECLVQATTLRKTANQSGGAIRQLTARHPFVRSLIENALSR